MVFINPEVFRQAGFVDLSDDQEITARFYKIHVFNVQGISIHHDKFVAQQVGEVRGHDYTVGIGNSVNLICQELLGDDLAEDEEKWRKDRGVKPPFLVLHFGPTGTHRCSKGLVKRDGKMLVTYECFAAAGRELSELESVVLAPVVSALTLDLSIAETPVALRSIDRVSYGITPNGETVRAVAVTSSGPTVQVSQKIKTEDIFARLKDAALRAARVHTKSARFFHLALTEEDELKSFLYFFLCIEVLTHSVFTSSEKLPDCTRLVDPPQRVVKAVNDLASRQRKEIRNVADRFVWCAACVWSSIGDHDVEEFRRLKEIRDGIAHGRREKIQQGSSRAAARLASKVMKERSGV